MKICFLPTPPISPLNPSTGTLQRKITASKYPSCTLSLGAQCCFYPRSSSCALILFLGDLVVSKNTLVKLKTSSAQNLNQLVSWL